MTRYTSGPWRCRATSRTIEIYPLDEAGLHPTLAVVQKWAREGVNVSYANAQIIAAAPELLDMLDNLVMACELPGDHDEVDNILPRAIALLERISGELK